MKRLEFIVLFLSVFLILPYLSLISTWSHEQAHITVLSKYSIEAFYKPDFLGQIPNFYRPLLMGNIPYGTTFVSTEKYSELNNSAKTEVNMAGTGSDLKFLYGIIYLLFFINLIPLLMELLKEKINVKNKVPLLTVIYWIAFLMIAWAFTIINNIQSNLFLPNADLSNLLSLWCFKC